MVNKENSNELTEAWRNTYMSTVTAGHLVFSETAVNVFNVSTVRGLILTSKEVTLSPFEMQTVPGVSKVTGHIKGVHVIAELRKQGFSNEVVANSTTLTLNPALVDLKFACKI